MRYINTWGNQQLPQNIQNMLWGIQQMPWGIKQLPTCIACWFFGQSYKFFLQSTGFAAEPLYIWCWWIFLGFHYVLLLINLILTKYNHGNGNGQHYCNDNGDQDCLKKKQRDINSIFSHQVSWMMFICWWLNCSSSFFFLCPVIMVIGDYCIPYRIWGIAWWGINVYLVCGNTMCVSTCQVEFWS